MRLESRRRRVQKLTWLVARLGVCFALGPWQRAAAQISPPGLGKAHVASWSALGVRQDLDTESRRESMTYVGVGAISQPNNMNPLQKPAILVVNEELFDQFRAHWLYSVALSYRRQNEYDDEAPFAVSSSPTKHELRLYGRYAHVFKAGHFKIVNTLRPELRNFFAAALPAHEEFIQMRFRFRSQLSWSLDMASRHRLVTSAEVLSSVGKVHAPAGWGSFDYRESRFCLYYSWSPKPGSLVLNIGYMNDLLGHRLPVTDVHYLALDVIWENPVRVHRQI